MGVNGSGCWCPNRGWVTTSVVVPVAVAEQKGVGGGPAVYSTDLNTGYFTGQAQLTGELMAKKKTHSGDPKLTAAAKALGHAGGVKGGPARAKKLTAEQRSEIAKLGGLAHDSKSGVKGKERMTSKEKKHREGKDHKKAKGDSK